MYTEALYAHYFSVA